MRRFTLPAVGLLLLGAGPAHAVVVDFEDVSIPGTNANALVRSDRLTAPGGIEIVMGPFASADESYRVYDLGRYAPTADVDTQALLVSSINYTPVTFTFSASVFGLSMLIGDFGSDTDTVTVEFLDGAGEVAAEQTQVFPQEAGTLFETFASGGVYSGFRVSSDTSNSVFLDDIAFEAATAVPLPAAAGLLVAGLAAIGAARLRR